MRCKKKHWQYFYSSHAPVQRYTKTKITSRSTKNQILDSSSTFSVRILFTLKYLILAFNFETFVANLFSKYKQAKRDCRTARSWSTRHCNKQDSTKTEVSSSMSLPSNILLYETDSRFHKRLAAHRLLSPDKIHINLKTIRNKWIAMSTIGNIYYHEHRCPRFDWTALQVVRTSFLGPRPRFYPPPPCIEPLLNSVN